MTSSKALSRNPFHNPRLLVVVATAAVFLGLFAKLTEDVFEQGELQRLDSGIMFWVGAWRPPALNGVAVDLTALGSPVVVTLVTIVGLAVLVMARSFSGAIYLATCAVGSAALTAILKPLIGRERPNLIPHLVEVSGRSYPSGHTVAAASVFLALAILACHRFNQPRSQVILLAMAAFIIAGVGLSRIYLGVHYPSDVLSGSFLGAGWALLLAAVLVWRKTK